MACFICDIGFCLFVLFCFVFPFTVSNIFSFLMWCEFLL
jgi:hypothetical protein